MRAASLCSSWPLPSVKASTKIGIPEITMEHPLEAPAQWRTCAEAWLQSNGDCTVWREYTELVQSGRYGTPPEGQEAYGFAETFVGLRLEREGFQCYRSARLFIPSHQPHMRPENTAAVRDIIARLRLPLPNEIQDRFDRPFKNPDLTAYRAESNDLVFIEVKRDEPVDPEQTDCLAALHFITGARVAIVRLVPEGTAALPRNHVGSFVFTGPGIPQSTGPGGDRAI
jgi:hypothetical protein